MEMSENKRLVGTEQPNYKSIIHSRELILDDIIKDTLPIISLLESKLNMFSITPKSNKLDSYNITGISPRASKDTDYQFIYDSYIHFFYDGSNLDRQKLSDIQTVLHFFIHIRKHIHKSLDIIQQNKITIQTESDIIQLNNIYLWILLNYSIIPERIDLDAIEDYYMESINDNFNYTNIIDIDQFIKIYQYFKQLNINIEQESVYKYIDEKCLYYMNIKIKDKQKFYTTICTGLTSMCNCIAGGYTSPCPDSGACVLGTVSIGNHAFEGCKIPGPLESNDNFSGFSIYGDATPFLNMLPKCWSSRTKILYFKSVLSRSDFDQLNQTIKYKLSLILLIISKNSKTDVDNMIDTALDKLIHDMRFGVRLSCTPNTTEIIESPIVNEIDPSERLKKYIKYKKKYIKYKNKYVNYKNNSLVN